MDKKELREILDLVKAKLAVDAEAACGLFWADDPEPTPKYATPDDPAMRYAISEEE